MAEWWGYGDDYGYSETGYGDPVVAAGTLFAPADGIVPDDGGVVVTLVGSWDAPPYTVTVGGVQAFPYDREGFGVVPSAAGDRLAFVVPGGLPLGAADVVVRGADGVVQLAGALTVVRRHRRDLYYLLNRLASPLGPHPGRGPVDPTADTLWSPS